jgi:hypothetical protein
LRSSGSREVVRVRGVGTGAGADDPGEGCSLLPRVCVFRLGRLTSESAVKEEPYSAPSRETHILSCNRNQILTDNDGLFVGASPVAVDSCRAEEGWRWDGLGWNGWTSPGPK